MNQISGVELSTLQDTLVLIHCDDIDLLLENSHRTELVTVLAEYYEAATGRKLNINFTDKYISFFALIFFSFHFHVLYLTFALAPLYFSLCFFTCPSLSYNDVVNSMTAKIRPGDQRTITFQKDESAQSLRIRKQGKILTVMIASGLDKNTDTTPQGFSPGAGSVGRGRGGGRAGICL
jgi:hypothetical protein